jgi:hypothetical protein
MRRKSDDILLLLLFLPVGEHRGRALNESVLGGGKTHVFFLPLFVFFLVLRRRRVTMDVMMRVSVTPFFLYRFFSQDSNENDPFPPKPSDARQPNTHNRK